jgi:hypothetical protein
MSNKDIPMSQGAPHPLTFGTIESNTPLGMSNTAEWTYKLHIMCIVHTPKTNYEMSNPFSAHAALVLSKQSRITADKARTEHLTAKFSSGQTSPEILELMHRNGKIQAVYDALRS